MTSTEVAEKNESEFKDTTEKEIVSTTTTTTTKEQFVSKYLQIKQSLNNKITTLFQDKYWMYPNRKIGTFLFDLFLISKLVQQSDVIFEFKYYPNGFTRYRIQDALLKLEMGTILYADKVRPNIISVLMAVTPEKYYNAEEIRILKLQPFQLNHLNVDNVRIEFLSEGKLDGLSNTVIENLIKK